MSDRNYSELVERMVARLKESRKVLFLTTSNRWVGEKGGEMPKSTRLAYHIADMVGEGQVEVIEVPKLNIYPCEGNVSTARGDTCGLKSARLKDDEKNPSGHHRCWASFNNEDDELWKVSKPLFEADAVVFFGSVRWGQMNSFYQKLIERLTWLENRHTGLGESNLLAEKNAGIVIVGQNWNGAEVLKTQRQVLDYFGFRVADELSFNWQYTDDPEDESDESYKAAAPAFERDFGL
jgi:multimeric flavodoxin WrbA